MDMRLLRLRNAFALQYKRVYSESLSISEFEAGGKGAALVAKSLHSADPRLTQAAKELAEAMGIQASITPVRSVETMPEPVAVKPTRQEREKASREELGLAARREAKLFEGQPGITAKQWRLIEECAREVAGPIADLWLDQAKEEGPGSFKDAVVITSSKLGSFGKEFAAAIRSRIKGSGA